MIAVHALTIFFEKIGFGYSITCNDFFYTKKNFYINFLCTWRVLQILIGNGYLADGQLLCAYCQNATQGIVLFDF